MRAKSYVASIAGINEKSSQYTYGSRKRNRLSGG